MEDRMTPIGDSDDITGSRNLLTIFRRRIWVIVPVAIVIFALVGAYAVTRPKIYESAVWMLVADAGGGSNPMEKARMLTEVDVMRTLQSDVSMHIRLIKRAEMAEEVKAALGTESDEDAAEMVHNLDVAKVPGTSANLIALTYRSERPEAAQVVANEWANTYRNDSRQRATLSVASALEYVQTQIEDVEGELRSMEEQMAALEQEYLESGINVAIATENEQVIALMREISQSSVEMDALQAQIAKTQGRIDEEPREIVAIQEEPSHRASAIEQELSQLYIEIEEKLGDYYEDSPEIQALRDQVARLEQRLEDREKMVQSAVTTEPNPVYMNAQDKLITLYGELDALRAGQVVLQTQLAQQQRLAATAPAGNIAFHELLRKVQGLEVVHASLLGRMYELQLERATAVAPVQIIREAQISNEPVSPKYPMLFGIGLVAALLLSAVTGLVVDQIDDTFANADEIGATLGERLVGVLPEAEAMRKTKVMVTGTAADTRSPFANAVTMLASTVRIEMSQLGLSSLCVTSSGPSEGKSLTSANLAASFASAGEKVLLIDCDLHRPSINEILDLPKDPGLSNLLMQDVDVGSVIQDTPFPNLKVITAGPQPPSPVDLLASKRGQQVIERLNIAADYVIWDTPPAGFLADATIIGHKTDRTLFVVGREAKRSAVRQTVRSLRQAGIKLVGITVNRVRPQGGSYSYYYSNYDEETPDDEKQPGSA